MFGAWYNMILCVSGNNKWTYVVNIIVCLFVCVCMLSEWARNKDRKSDTYINQIINFVLIKTNNCVLWLSMSLYTFYKDICGTQNTHILLSLHQIMVQFFCCSKWIVREMCSAYKSLSGYSEYDLIGFSLTHCVSAAQHSIHKLLENLY